MEAAEDSRLEQRNPASPNEPSSAEAAGGPLKASPEGFLLQSADTAGAGGGTGTGTGTGGEDQLEYADQEPPESSAHKKLCIEQNADIFSMESQHRLTEEEVFELADQSEAGDCSTQLSDMPDEVLIRILSLLPLKEAVRTSMLSKRWEHLWAFLPDLHFSNSVLSKRSVFLNYFSNSDLSKRSLFLDFVGRACALREGSPIRIFSLLCEVDGAESRIKNLITSVVACGVQDLSLSLPSDCIRSPVLPSSLYMCGTLERLRLRARCFLNLPSSICLSKLKVLVLSKVSFRDDGTMEKLFSSPLLEELELDYCRWFELKSSSTDVDFKVLISAPKLQRLCMKMSRLSYGCRLHLYGSRLKSFHYQGGVMKDYCILGHTRQLVEAKLLLLRGALGDGEVAQGCKLKVLSTFSNVKELTLSDRVLEDLVAVDELPLFMNMIILTLDRISYMTIKGIWAILRRSPCLRSLCFRMGFKYYPGNGRDEFIHEVPSCFLAELTNISVKFCDMIDSQEALFMLGFFLEKVVSLREMIIQFREDYTDKEKLLEDLSNFPKGSKDCLILLHPQPRG